MYITSKKDYKAFLVTLLFLQILLNILLVSSGIIHITKSNGTQIEFWVIQPTTDLTMIIIFLMLLYLTPYLSLLAALNISLGIVNLFYLATIQTKIEQIINTFMK